MSRPTSTFRAPDAVSNSSDRDTSEAQKLGRQRNRQSTREALMTAMQRIKSETKKLTISAVAVEAGVTPALIHNTYPEIAEAIRAEIGKSTRQQRDKKIAELIKVRARNKELRAELEAALADIQRLASSNETLRQELGTLRSVGSGKVVLLPASFSSPEKC